MYKYTLDFLYDKKKDFFHEDMRILKIVGMFNNPLDKEVVIMLQAIVNEPHYTTAAVLGILGTISPMTPAEWIKSESPMLVFTSQTHNRLLGDYTKLGRVIKPIGRLVELYKEYDDLKDFIKRNRCVCPQECLSKWLFGNSKDCYHLGLARYIPVLSRKGDSAALDLINRVAPKNLYLPRTKKIVASALNVRMITKTEENPYEVIREKLIELDKNDPFKYIPILDNTNPRVVIKKMGYLIH